MPRAIALLTVLVTQLGATPPPAASDSAPATLDCISLNAVTNRYAEDERTIRFDLIGGRTYRNILPGRCPGLRQSSQGFGALAFEVQGGQLCRGDRVRVVDSASPRGLANSIPCLLGAFVESPVPAR